MAKVHSHYVCQQCGYESTGWLGKCPNCGTWGSMVEMVEASISKNSSNTHISAGKSLLLSDIQSHKISRVSTKSGELDRALGGGIVNGQAILLAGSPGIGKSTILLQIANNLGNVMYASGEESANQIALRAQRLQIKNKKINIVEETDIDTIIETARALKPSLLIVDSIQVMATSSLTGMAGSVGQVCECAFRLVKYAKSTNTPVFIVGHVTKEGSVAGPAVLAHIVDTVLWFEGDKSLTLRMIRATKNRFGPSDEVGVFEMKEKGLISLTHPENLFLTDSNIKSPGRVTSAILQGTRPVLLEVESLVVPSKLAFPKRIAQGIDQRRFELLIAILTKHCKMPLYDYDCFVNIAGGIKASSPAVDLGICLSLASSFYNKEISKNILAVGEVGLLGEIRQVMGHEKISKLASSLHYTALAKNDNFLPKVVHNLFSPQKRS